MFIATVSEDGAEGAVAEYYETQRAAWGFLPNYALAFATRPDVAQAWNALNAAVRGGMDRRRFEIATIAAARARRSTCCTAAHSAFLRDVCGDATAMESIAEQPDGAGLRAVGLSGADVADVVFAAAARSFFTAVLDGLGTQLDAQTAATFARPVLAALVVGRPVAPA